MLTWWLDASEAALPISAVDCKLNSDWRASMLCDLFTRGIEWIKTKWIRYVILTWHTVPIDTYSIATTLRWTWYWGSTTRAALGCLYLWKFLRVNSEQNSYENWSIQQFQFTLTSEFVSVAVVFDGCDISVSSIAESSACTKTKVNQRSIRMKWAIMSYF